MSKLLFLVIAVICGIIGTSDSCQDLSPPETCRKAHPLWCRFFLRTKCAKSCGYCKNNPTTKPTTPPPLTWNTWSPCSRSCGGGTRLRVMRCPLNDINRCDKFYEDCQPLPCPKVVCSNQQVHRYNDTSQCCTHRPEHDCRATVPVAGRVLGGTTAPEGQWPSMVRLEIQQKTPGVRTLCGGNLLSKDWAVTAGHCLEGFTSDKVTAYVGWGTVAQTRHLVDKIIFHPKYKFPGIDIVLIKFVKSAEFHNDFVSPICLPQGEQTADDKKCYVAGWGVNQTIGGGPTPKLQQALLRKLPFGVCGSAYAGRNFIADISESRTICAGRIAGGLDTCFGDSGGPLVCQRCSSCSWYLAGVISFGTRRCGLPGFPALYVNLVQFESWISKNVPGLKGGKRTCA